MFVGVSLMERNISKQTRKHLCKVLSKAQEKRESLIFVWNQNIVKYFPE